MSDENTLFLTKNNNYNKKNTKIILQTSKGNSIDNYQVKELSKFELNKSGELEKKYVLSANLKFIGNPTPMYNCHGFTFASRRTNIDLSNELRKIIVDDCYERIIKEVDVMPGDVVFYVSTETDGDIIHSGLVIRNENLTEISNIVVLSKWGKYKEVTHPLRVDEYSNCKYEFWRINHGYEVQ